ncbi:MAG: hypothetical protein OES13_06945 [Acidimicrobiia bacterium]|nr:hypothetical protein [Acidimicrobiia bacterium]
MNIEASIIAFEETLAQQATLGGDAVEEAAGALLQAVRPAVERLALSMAEDAALEVAAQLPDATVRVVIEEGSPALMVERQETVETAAFKGEDLEARLTLRLPTGLKSAIEEAAGDAGDSVNSHVVEALGQALQRHRQVSTRRFTGTIET